jgi:hypothetical protein
MRSGGGGADARSCVVAVAVRGGLLPSEPTVVCRHSDAQEHHEDRASAPRSSPSSLASRPAPSERGGGRGIRGGGDEGRCTGGERHRGDGDEKKGGK